MILKGIAASNGIVVGKVFKLVQPVIKLDEKFNGTEKELELLNSSLSKTISDIEQVKLRASKNLSKEELAVFDAHLMMVQDPEYKAQIENEIKNGLSCSKACKLVSDNMIKMFESMDNDYFKERAADIKDVSFRLLCNILGLIIPDLTAICEKVIVVAEDLTPSDTAQLNKEFVLGFVTAIGGRTSHSAIMARSLEIPAIVGVKDLLENVKHNDLIAMDAINGEIILNPDNITIDTFEKNAKEFLDKKNALKALIDKETITLDGHKVEIASNIGTPKDVESVVANGAEGIGLYRTEFLYMDSKNDFPSEEDQFNAYKIVLESMKGKKVVVRTLDIGGDKKLDYFTFPQEMNPFLGYRAIRFCLDRKDIFKTQIRALLRASVYGKLCIMFPMIATVDEFRQGKQFVLDTKQELLNEGIQVSDDIEIGMMVEIPSTAILADQFSKYADFFSIGTNDLIQYTFAADRMSEKVSYLYQPLNPSILRLVKLTIDGAHKNGKWVGMCGEMAGDKQACPILLGLGLDEFSMSATSMLETRSLINSLKFSDMQKLALKVIELDTEEEVKELLKNSL